MMAKKDLSLTGTPKAASPLARRMFSWLAVGCMTMACMTMGCQRHAPAPKSAAESTSKARATEETKPAIYSHSVADAQTSNEDSDSGKAATDKTESNESESNNPEPSTIVAMRDELAALPHDLANQLPERRPHGGYVTSEACIECHPNQHASWSHSYHRSMTRVVSNESVAGGFDGVTRRIYDWDFTPEKRGDEYWYRLDTTDGSGNSFEYQLLMRTGSHYMQKFWYHTGTSRKVGMAPLVYVIEADKWMPESSAFLGPPDHRLRLREGAWNTGCIQCHATASQPRISSSDDMNPLVAEFGISCEACHGPGEKHIEDKTAASIVNPRKLPAERSAQVCGQCHGAWLHVDGSGRTWAQTGHEYRPGDDLFASRYYPHGPQDRHLHARIKAVESFWPDGENRVAGRELHGLLSSPCFANDQDDARRMTCIACHDLHAESPDKSWANQQLGPEMRSNEACLQCHAEFREDVSAHTHHTADSSGSLCYNCHMPYTSYGLLKAVRTHTIVRPSARVTAETGKPNACNQCHLDQTLDWAAGHLEARYGQEKPELSHDDQQIAASILWALKGDAAQRAVMAWTMGWAPAREAAGENWQPFYLANLMFDDYDAIRYVAYRSLKQIPGYESIEFDHLQADEERSRVMNEILSRWQALNDRPPTDSKLLFDESGDVMQATYDSLLQMRDNRPISITE